MKTLWIQRGGRDGAALFSIMLVLLIAAALLGVVSKAALQRVYTTHKLADRVRALSIAEAGANQAYSILQTNFTARTSDALFPETVFAGGTFDVTVTPVGDNVAVIHSDGSYGDAHESVILDVQNFGEASPGGYEGPAFTFTVLAGGTITWTGASEMYGGKIHSNNWFERSGNGWIGANVSSSTGFRSNGNANGIDGDVTAPVVNGNLSKISGDITVTNVPVVSIPDIDLTPYYNHALANGEVRNGNVTLSSAYTPAGGVLWVNGTLSLAGNTTFNGSFISTGNLSISGNGAINNTTTYPTLASRDGNISFTGQKAVAGLIYAKTGNYSQTGGNALTGQIIVRGNFSKGGNSAVMSYADSTPIAPGSNGSTEDLIYATAWQK